MNLVIHGIHEHTLPLYSLHVNFVVDVQCNQDPHPAEIGGLVDVTCTGAHKGLSENLEWKLPNGTRIDGVPGVKGINMMNTPELAKAALSLNLTAFPAERTVSCGLNYTFVNYTICGEYMYIRMQRSDTYVHSTYDGLLCICAYLYFIMCCV